MTRQHPQLAAALDAATRGWPVFPLVPGEKRPAIRDWETRATTDPERIRRCWTAGSYGVAVATGPAGLVVLDLDLPKQSQDPPPELADQAPTCGMDTLIIAAREAGQAMPFDTHTVHTPTGGTHLYYTAPTGTDLRNTTGRLGWLIDTRAHGGYVAAPGTHIDGRPYQAADDVEPATLPGWLADRLADSHTPPSGSVALPEIADRGGYLHTAVQQETQRVQRAPQGQRNRALYIAATALGQLVAGDALTEHDVYDVLLTAAREHITTAAYDTRQARRTIASGLAAGAHRPRQVAA